MFASGSVFENSFFKKEMEVIEAAINIIQQYNDGSFIDRHIYLNQPGIWQILDGSRVGERCLVEPFISNFQKFNSNSGWRDLDGTAWNLVMQSISHFSYHVSGGNLLLCDLQV
jgi:Alpha-kinase family